MEKEIKLADRNGKDTDVLVVSSPGGSAQWISVVEIKQNPPSLKILLDGVLDKGGFDYRYYSAGRIIGFKFNYMAWHVKPGDLQGHVFTDMNVGWLPGEHRCRIDVNDKAEQRASLVEILDATGAEQLLDMKVMCNKDSDTYIYEPARILLQKTPTKLRLAAKVKMVVKYDANRNPKIAKIEALNGDK